MTSYGSGLREVLAKGAHACCGRMTVLAVSDGNRWDHRCDSLETLMVYRWSLSGQRCFLRVSKGDAITEFSLFPTHVGVYRGNIRVSGREYSLPHARGGVPSPGKSFPCDCASSPRTWGCTGYGLRPGVGVGLFPTHVGVYRRVGRFPVGPSPLPHARGGVPRPRRSCEVNYDSSPRTWGCTDLAIERALLAELFPTHVGVYRRVGRFPDGPSPLPHARGGVPGVSMKVVSTGTSSPRTWGCTDVGGLPLDIGRLFPTHVGVYRAPATRLDRVPP